MNGVCAPRTDADLFEWLSNVELSTVLDGGSCAVVAIDAAGEEYSAWIDIDGLSISGEGYVTSVRGWKVERHY